MLDECFSNEWFNYKLVWSFRYLLVVFLHDEWMFSNFLGCVLTTWMLENLSNVVGFLRFGALVFHGASFSPSTSLCGQR